MFRKEGFKEKLAVEKDVLNTRFYRTNANTMLMKPAGRWRIPGTAKWSK